MARGDSCRPQGPVSVSNNGSDVASVLLLGAPGLVLGYFSTGSPEADHPPTRQCYPPHPPHVPGSSTMAGKPLTSCLVRKHMRFPFLHAR